jgi:hypothetical protein
MSRAQEFLRATRHATKLAAVSVATTRSKLVTVRRHIDRLLRSIVELYVMTLRLGKEIF